jgi:nucleoside-diphosphate-sugar epimerase
MFFGPRHCEIALNGLAQDVGARPVDYARCLGNDSMAKYLITGIAGFIGSSLARALVEHGEQVRGMDNYLTGKAANLAGLENQIDFREADMRDAVATRAACEGIDYILHLGALPSVPLSVKDPEPSHDCNVNGTFHVLEGARAAGVKRVVYAASSSAYGDQPVLPSKESMRPMPISPYAVQKLTGEHYMSSYWQVYGLETVSLRYFNVFGPRQGADSPYSGVLAKFIQQMLEGTRPTIFGSGEQGRDFTYIDNVVSANLLACAAPAEKVAGKVFNAACGGQHTLKEIYQLLAKLIGFDLPPLYGPPRTGDILNSQADISAATEAFGYRPSIGVKEGLERTVEWYRQTLKLPVASR